VSCLDRRSGTLQTHPHSSFPRLWPILIAYLSWICIFDYAPERGGRSSDRIRKARFWKYFAGYFPISLISTCELPPDRTYIFGSHPHGIIGVGAMANFASDVGVFVCPFSALTRRQATSFSTTFPGIRPHLLTLATNFQLPFYRDLLLALGICSVSRRSCQNILRQGPGSSITIVIGGAAESLSARPGTADLTLRKRLGFIKLAIREGADLVPTFSFGENDIFSQLDNHRGTRLRTIQKRFQKAFGFTLRA
jgi:2-acylglycerol O-acyltransferase 2